MARKSRYNIPTLFWRCPHCGFEHTAADLVRIDGDTFRCKEVRRAVSFWTGTREEVALQYCRSQALRCRERARRVYYGCVFKAKKEIPVEMFDHYLAKNKQNENRAPTLLGVRVEMRIPHLVKNL